MSLVSTATFPGSHVWCPSIGAPPSLHKTFSTHPTFTSTLPHKLPRYECKLYRNAATDTISTASTNTVSLEQMIIPDGPPRLLSPFPDPSIEDPIAGRSSLPLMIYLPGIDGTGLAAARQFKGMMSCFDLVTLVTPPTDRTDFDGLVQVVTDFLEHEIPLHSPTRPVYLLGESFGGVLAIAVAAKSPALVDRLVLVNPATSFEDSIWPLIGPLLPQVPSQAYQALPIALAPVLGNPINLLSAALDSTDADASVTDRLNAVVRGAAQLLAQLPLLADLLPPQTLAWKLQLLQQGCQAVAPVLSSIPQRTLIIVGDEDLLLPSKTEGPRLQKALPRAHLRVEKGRSHALLQEGGVDLVRIMDQEGALVTKRRMSAPLKQRAINGSGFGTAAPIELPTEVELKRYADRTTAIGRRLSSPIFLSKDEASGTIALGLGNIPDNHSEGPILYVGNHQTLALDLGVLCEEFLTQRGILLRGLAHPVIFNNNDSMTQDRSQSQKNEGAKNSQQSPSQLPSPFDIMPFFGEIFSGRNELSSSSSSNSSRNSTSRQAFADFMIEFGAVPVSGRNLVRLLQNKESVLLFPGGVREAYKRKNEEYKLFWPQRAEFVRMAAKYGATIVPFSAIGVDDSLDIVLDSDELQKAPFIGGMVRSRAAQLPQARRGVSRQKLDATKGLNDSTNSNNDESEQGYDEAFISPLAVPKLPPRRMYFLFHSPIRTTHADLEDRERCEELYRRVKSDVEGGLDYLLHNRNNDPYEDFTKRAIYEASRGGRQAPTFPF